MTYKHNKEWRRKNPEKRAEKRKKYYNKTSGYMSRNYYRRWSRVDCGMILHSKLLSDMALHEILGRSVQAIQCKRHEIRKEAYENNRRN